MPIMLVTSRLLLVVLLGVVKGDNCRFWDGQSLVECQPKWEQVTDQWCGGGRSLEVGSHSAAWAGLATIKGFNGYSMTRWALEEENVDWKWDSTIINKGLRQAWWPFMWAIITLLLICLTVSFIPSWLFCWCCRKEKKIESKSKVTGIVAFSICMALALGATIGTQISAFKAVDGLRDAQCQGLAQPYSFLYETVTSSRGKRFEGVASFLTLSQAITDRTKASQELVRASEGRLGRLAAPMLRGLYAPILWTDAYLRVQPHRGWLSHLDEDFDFTLGLQLRHAEPLRQIMESMTPSGPDRITYGLANNLLQQDTTMTWDHQPTIDTMDDVVTGIQDAQKIITENLGQVGDGMQKVLDFNEEVGDGNKIAGWSPWIYHWFPIVTYVFLALGGFFFWRYLQRKDDNARPTPGLNFYIFCGFIGACLWLSLAVVQLSMGSFTADVCSFAKKDLLEKGLYFDYFESSSNNEAEAENLIKACLVETGNGNLLEALEIDLTDLDTISADDFSDLDKVFEDQGSFLDTTALDQYVQTNQDDLKFIESVKYPSATGADALSLAALKELTEALNSILGSPAIYVCSSMSDQVCTPGAEQTVYTLTTKNTYYTPNPEQNDAFFKPPIPVELSAGVAALTPEVRRDWYQRAYDLIIRSTLVSGEGFRRSATDVPTTDEQRKAYVFDVCPIDNKCLPFHRASVSSDDKVLESITLSASLDNWQTTVATDMEALAKIAPMDDVVTSIINGFLSASPLMLIDSTAQSIIDRWSCTRAFDILHSIWTVGCANVAGHGAVNGWLSLVMGVVMTVGSSIAMAHWTRRRRSYLTTKPKKSDEQKDARINEKKDDDEEAPAAEEEKENEEEEQPVTEQAEDEEEEEEDEDEELFNVEEKDDLDGEENEAAAEEAAAPNEKAVASPPIIPLLAVEKMSTENSFLPIRPPNTPRELQLFAAAHLGVVDQIAGARIPPNSVVDDHNGNSPLHLAANGGFADCVRYLCEEGWDVNARNQMGLTPAEVALSNDGLPIESKERVLRVLGRHGADIEGATRRAGGGSPIGNVSYRFPPVSG